MERNEAWAAFREVVAELLGIEVDDIRPEATWESMDVDSLALTEIALAVCDTFAICLPEVDNDQIETVGQVFELTLTSIDDPACAVTSS